MEKEKRSPKMERHTMVNGFRVKNMDSGKSNMDDATSKNFTIKEIGVWVCVMDRENLA